MYLQGDCRAQRCATAFEAASMLLRLASSATPRHNNFPRCLRKQRKSWMITRDPRCRGIASKTTPKEKGTTSFKTQSKQNLQTGDQERTNGRNISMVFEVFGQVLIRSPYFVVHCTPRRLSQLRRHNLTTTFVAEMSAALARPSFLSRLSSLFHRSTALSAATTDLVFPSLPGVRTLEGLRGVLDSLLLAVPKKKTTPGKKRKRMTNKWLRPDLSIRRCEICDRWKRAHTYCKPNCIGRREMQI